MTDSIIETIILAFMPNDIKKYNKFKFNGVQIYFKSNKEFCF